MKFKKNVSSLLVCSLLVTTTVPHNVIAETYEDYRAEFYSVESEKKIADVFNKFPL